MAITNSEKLLLISADVDTVDRRSALIQSRSQYVTVGDLLSLATPSGDISVNSVTTKKEGFIIDDDTNVFQDQFRIIQYDDGYRFSVSSTLFGSNLNAIEIEYPPFGTPETRIKNDTIRFQKADGSNMLTLDELNSATIYANQTSITKKLTVGSSGTGNYIKFPVESSNATVSSPAKGMVIFDDSVSKLQVYDGTSWVNLH